MTTEICPGCKAVLPVTDGVIHRYMTSSAACWGIFNSLSTENLLSSNSFNHLIVDTYAVQHPGTPSNQTINSVAIHAMVLHGILERGFKPDQTLWLRQRPGRIESTKKHQRFEWLTPPNFDLSLTIADVSTGRTLLEDWVKDVWLRWSEPHGKQIAIWFERYVLSENF